MDLNTTALADWFSQNRIEVTGALLGIVYIFFSIRQNILTWPVGLLSSLLYAFVFMKAKFYAGMGLQVYYVFISMYGWYFWIRGKREEPSGTLPVTRLMKAQTIILGGILCLLFVTIFSLLRKFTDSPVPIPDAFITSIGIVATWMLARKIIENWLLWIISDAVAIALYISRGLWPTTILYIVYIVLAFVGYRKWEATRLQEAL
jgi:nicotinamide mononucleotide transporter